MPYPTDEKDKPRLVASEKQITERFVALVSPRFELWPQVTLKHPLGYTFRIDFVGRERAGQYKGWIGFELKRGAYDHFGQFTKAIKQAIDYMQCAIQSDFPDANPFNQRLRHAFVFPCPFNVKGLLDHANDGIPDMWAQGMVRLAGRFGVGVMAKVWNDYELILADQTVYELSTGRVRHLAQVHCASTKFGSC